MGRTERNRRADELLAEVGLQEQVNRRPGALSGGQQQRVAIARALINDPDVILADEPTGALDSKTSQQVMEILRTLHARGKTIGHGHSFNGRPLNMPTRIVLMSDGVVHRFNRTKMMTVQLTRMIAEQSARALRTPFGRPNDWQGDRSSSRA